MALSYKVSQGNVFGRVAKGFAEGFGPQLSKEMEHSRLNKGLKELANDSGNLTPEQYYAKAAGTYGITPQMLQGFETMSKQRAKGNALAAANPEAPGTKYAPPEKSPSASPELNRQTPSTVKPTTIEKALGGIQFLDEEQKDAETYKRFSQNPARYNNNSDLARESVEKDEIIKKANYDANQDLLKVQTEVQKMTTDGLRNHSNQLKVQVPPDVYSRIEDEAIESTKPVSEGGEGKTWQQALKDSGKKLDEISREYSDVKSLGGIGMLGRSASQTQAAYKKAQREFEKRGDSRNLADFLVAENNVSYPLAYAVAEPVSKVPQLSTHLRALPDLPIIGVPGGLTLEQKRSKTLGAAPKIIEKMGDASPLSIVYELEKKNYDGKTFMDYLMKTHYDNLTGRQIEQTGKPINTFGSLNDWWLQDWSGIGG